MDAAQYVAYAGSYAAADQPGIYACAFDATTGMIAAQRAFSGITNPSFIAVHPNRRWLYAVSETSAGSVWALHCARDTWQIAPINRQASGGDAPCHLALDATGRWLVVSNYGTGTLGVLPIGTDGALGTMTDLIRHAGSGHDPERQAGPHAHSTIFTPDNRYVIAADLGADEVLVYAFEAAAGRLRLHTRVATRPGAGPRHMVFDPGGTHLYVANELDNTVAVYRYDPARAELHEQQISPTLPADAPESWVADIHLLSTGTQLYVSNRGHDSLAVFEIAPDGHLVKRAIQSCGGRWPRHFTIAPDDRFVLAANQGSDQLAVLSLQDGVGTPGSLIASAVVKQATCVVIVPALWSSEFVQP